MAVATPTTTPIPRPVLDHIHPEPTGFIRKYIFSIDHKIIAYQYFITAGLFFVIAGLLAEMIRIDLLKHTGVLTPNVYNQVYSVHGSMMVWLVIIPFVSGAFGNFVMPLQIGARDVAFPWLNLAAFWMFPPAGLILLASFAFGAPDAGWTEYPPISLQAPFGTSMWCIAIFLIGISSTLTGINFLVTIFKMRAPGMTFTRMPLFVWASAATAGLNMVATTALAAALLALFLERQFGVPFYNPTKGGSPILWQHMFWFYSHPAVYIMILPAMGVISEVVCTFSRKNPLSYKAIAYSSLGIALVGFLTWGHHLFVAGQSAYASGAFGIISELVAVFSAIKVVTWLGTMYRGSIAFTTPMAYVFIFLFLFVFGGMTGVAQAAMSLDVHWHDTYFIVAHFHFIMVGGTLTGLIAGLHYWLPKITGRLPNERVGLIAAALVLMGFVITFVPQFLLGNAGMPRRYYDYPVRFQALNVISTVGSWLLSSGILLAFGSLLHAAFRGPRAGSNPWGSRSFEWRTASPPITANFERPLDLVPGAYDYSVVNPHD